MRRIRFVAVCLIGLLMASSCGGNSTDSAEGGNEDATVVVGMVTTLPLYWLVYIAEEEGFAAEENINLDVVVVDSAPNVVQQTAAGALDVGLSSPDSTIAAGQQGADLLLFAGNTVVAPWDLYAQPGIESVEDLKGRTLGATTTTTGEVVILKAMLERRGLEANKDYDLIAAGPSPARFTALTEGVIDGGVFSPPQTVMLDEAGYSLLASGVEEFPDYQFHAFMASRSWLESNPDVAVRFVKALIRSGRWLYDPANKERAAEILSDSIGVDLPLALSSYDQLIQDWNALAMEAELSLPGVEAAVQGLEEPPSDVAKYIDSTYQEQALKELE